VELPNSLRLRRATLEAYGVVIKIFKCHSQDVPGDAALVEGLFVTHLLSRMTREPIAIPSLDQGQGVSFLKDVLNQYRLDKNGPDE
jgi:hypothetical protein